MTLFLIMRLDLFAAVRPSGVYAARPILNELDTAIEDLFEFPSETLISSSDMNGLPGSNRVVGSFPVIG